MPKVTAEEILAVLDRPIAFQRVFVEVAGSVAGAVMLSQMVYWQRRCTGKGGWWFKSREDWTEEVGVTRREQETARAALLTRGVLEEETRGIPRRLYFRLDVERLAEIVTESSRSDVTSKEAESDQQVGTDRTNKRVRKRPASRSDVTSKPAHPVPTGSTETTAETSQETSEREAPASPDLSQAGQGRAEASEPVRASVQPAPRPPGSLASFPSRPRVCTQEELDDLARAVNSALGLMGKARLPAHAIRWESIWRKAAGDIEDAVKAALEGKRRCATAGNGVTLNYLERHFDDLLSAAHQTIESKDQDSNASVAARILAEGTNG